MFLNKKETLKLFKSYPNNKIDFPRDNELLYRTKDILFIAKILLNWKDEYTLLVLYVDKFYKRHYVFTKNNYNYYDINTGKEIVLKNFVSFKGRLKKSTVYSYIRKNYLPMRQVLKESNFYCPVSIENNSIFKDEIKYHSNLLRLDESLKFKLYEILSYKFLQNKIKRSFKKLICPFCGKVKPIKVKYDYPYWVRYHPVMCYTFINKLEKLLCPKCLGLFNTEVVYD